MPIDRSSLTIAARFEIHRCGDSDHIHLIAFTDTDEPFADITISCSSAGMIADAIKESAAEAMLSGKKGGHHDL